MFRRFFDNDPFFSNHLNHLRRIEELMLGMTDEPMFAIREGMENPESDSDRMWKGHCQDDLIDRNRRSRDLMVDMEPHSRSQDLMRANPFDFMNSFMQGMMGNMQGMMGNMQKFVEEGENDPDSNGAFYSYSSVSSYSSDDGTGQPKIYESTTTTRAAPGGVRETRKTVKDSVAGLEKMEIGRHIQDRGHVITRQRDVRTGDMEENQDFQNMAEADAPRFDNEWRQRTSWFNQYGAHRESVLGHNNNSQRNSPHNIFGFRLNEIPAILQSRHDDV